MRSWVPAWQQASLWDQKNTGWLGHSGQADSAQEGSLCSRGPCFLRVQTERVPLDVSPRLEEALDFSELEAEPSEGGDFEARGSRFSKSADERQRMLVQRKDDLLQQARK